MIFYFNHFSLIIFYHSVWSGFELFGFRVQVHCRWYSFTLEHKGYDNHHCHNKTPDRKWGWSVDDVILGKDGPENLGILKKSQLRGWIWAVEDVVGIFGSLSIEILNITRCAARWVGVSIVRIVSFSSSRRTEVRINKPFVPEQQSRLYLYCVFAFVNMFVSQFGFFVYGISTFVLQFITVLININMYGYTTILSNTYTCEWLFLFCLVSLFNAYQPL